MRRNNRFPIRFVICKRNVSVCQGPKAKIRDQTTVARVHIVTASVKYSTNPNFKSTFTMVVKKIISQHNAYRRRHKTLNLLIYFAPIFLALEADLGVTLSFTFPRLKNSGTNPFCEAAHVDRPMDTHFNSGNRVVLIVDRQS